MTVFFQYGGRQAQQNGQQYGSIPSSAQALFPIVANRFDQSKNETTFNKITRIEDTDTTNRYFYLPLA